MKTENYPIAETFVSVQGEGVHTGRKAYFVRLFGCNVKCPWCDSQSAWNGLPTSRMGADEIAAAAAECSPEFAVVTGGEPCVHNLLPLLEKFAEAKVAAHLETSGTLEIRERGDARFAWVAVSPKLFCPPLESSLQRADELKFIVSDLSELGEYACIAESAPNAKSVWLHPEWGRSRDRELLDGLSAFAVDRGGRYRLGWQMHKCYSVR